MKIYGALALLLFAGGCLPVPSSEVVSAAPAQPVAVTSPATQPEPPPTDGVPPETLPAEALPPTEQLPVEAGLADPVTAEDNFLLGDALQAPPADEGATVPAPLPEVTFDIPVVENAKVRHYLEHYSGRGKKTFARWLERSGRYLPMMREIFAEEGLPLDLTYLALVESGFNSRAHSWAKAVGPWQFIESTGNIFGLDNDWWMDERRDFEKSTRAAARFLRDLNRRFDGDWYLAIASYNAGPGKISRAIRKYGTRDFWELSRGSYLQAETKNYVPKLLATLMIAKEPEKYGFTDLDYQEPLAYETVQVPTTTDLEIVAGLCGVDYEAVKDLNPELKRWCTPPGATDYPVRVPAGAGEGFAEKYAEIPVAERANYLRHRVKSGDTLLALAQRYEIRVKDIIALNGIDNPRALRVGSDLILPLKEGYSSRPLDELADDYVRTRRKTYTVRKGDSLWKIARRFEVTQKQLRVWNRLGWSDLIRPGQKLQVSASGKAPKATAAKQKTAAAAQKLVYQVRPGDTLWAIGRRFDVATREIMAWNRLSDDHVLRPGDKLTLMVSGSRRG